MPNKSPCARRYSKKTSPRSVWFIREKRHDTVFNSSRKAMLHYTFTQEKFPPGSFVPYGHITQVHSTEKKSHENPRKEEAVGDGLTSLLYNKLVQLNN